MKIEIVEFYPIGKIGKDLKGTLHIYIIDTDQDLRGIFVKKTKDHWWFQIPYRVQYDPETKKEITFPVICFTQPEKHKEFFKLIQEMGKEYIEEHFIKNEKLDNKSKQV